MVTNREINKEASLVVVLLLRSRMHSFNLTYRGEEKGTRNGVARLLLQSCIHTLNLRLCWTRTVEDAHSTCLTLAQYCDRMSLL